MDSSPRRLESLTRNPREDLEVELKGWLDLDEGAHKADLAKAILALGNHGGGYVLIGYDDATRGPIPPTTGATNHYDQDKHGHRRRDPESVQHIPDTRYDLKEVKDSTGSSGLPP